MKNKKPTPTQIRTGLRKKARSLSDEELLSEGQVSIDKGCECTYCWPCACLFTYRARIRHREKVREHTIMQAPDFDEVFENIYKGTPGRLTKLREEKGVSRNDVAKVTGIGAKTIYHMETGRQKPTVSVLLALSEYYNKSMNWLITGS